MAPRGVFISFEGIDGAGKTTQARRLAARLEAAGRDVVLTREPGGAPGAEEIRELLVAGEPGRWSPETEILLFTAARRDHLEATIRPALAAGKIVVCDRFADSTRVYQGAVRGELRGLVDRLHAEVIATEPNVTVVIDADPEIAVDRGRARRSDETRFEAFGVEFQARLREGFRALAAEMPERVRVVEGAGTPGTVTEAVAAAVAPTLA